MSKTEVDVKCPFQSFLTIGPQTLGLADVRRSCIQLGWLTSKHQSSPVYVSSSPGIVDASHCMQIFMWVLVAQTQVSMLGE